jgi:hypothetical protein
VEPDLEGFVAAQERKRQVLGQEVTFFIPTDTVWPDVPVDEEGVPLDPTTQPLSSGVASASAVVSLVNRPVAGGARGIQPHSEETAVGLAERTSVIAIIGKPQYDELGLAGAQEAEVFEALYAVRDKLLDQMGPGPPQRVLIFLEKR